MKLQDIPAMIARELSIRPAQAEATVELLDAGNTLPFIARYRKENPFFGGTVAISTQCS